MNNSEKIAVTSRSFSKNSKLREELLAKYSNVKFNEDGKSLKGDELVSFLKGCDKAIVALELIDENLLQRLPQLQLISKYGVGLDNINFEALRKRNILLSWTGGVNRRAVAELALSFFLISLRKTFYSNRVIKENNWHQVQGFNLSEKTVGIIGLGHIGQELVELLQPFKTKILANDILENKTSYANEHGIELCSKERILKEADIVTLHIPLTSKTQNMINLDTLKLMKPESILVNTARGGLVNEADLLMALNEGIISGAAFDVFQDEPYIDQSLLHHPHFLATPHIGGSSYEAVLQMGRAAISGLKSGKEAKHENFFNYQIES